MSVCDVTITLGGHKIHTRYLVRICIVGGISLADHPPDIEAVADRIFSLFHSL